MTRLWALPNETSGEHVHLHSTCNVERRCAALDPFSKFPSRVRVLRHLEKSIRELCRYFAGEITRNILGEDS